MGNHSESRPRIHSLLCNIKVHTKDWVGWHSEATLLNTQRMRQPGQWQLHIRQMQLNHISGHIPVVCSIDSFRVSLSIQTARTYFIQQLVPSAVAAHCSRHVVGVFFESWRQCSQHNHVAGWYHLWDSLIFLTFSLLVKKIHQLHVCQYSFDCQNRIHSYNPEHLNTQTCFIKVQLISFTQISLISLISLPKNRKQAYDTTMLSVSSLWISEAAEKFSQNLVWLFCHWNSPQLHTF
jgi:hypothetical protein